MTSAAVEACAHPDGSPIEVEARWEQARTVTKALAWCSCCLGPALAELIELGNGQHIGRGVLCSRCQKGGAA